MWGACTPRCLLFATSELAPGRTAWFGHTSFPVRLPRYQSAKPVTANRLLQELAPLCDKEPRRAGFEAHFCASTHRVLHKRDSPRHSSSSQPVFAPPVDAPQRSGTEQAGD